MSTKSTCITPALRLPDHVRTLSWSADSRCVAAALGNGDLCLLDAATETVTRHWTAHAGGVFHGLFSPLRGSCALASAGEDGLSRWWHGETGAPLGEYSTGVPWVEHLAWSPGGRHLAAAAGRKLFRFSGPGEIVGEPRQFPGTIASLAWRPNGEALAVARYGQVDVVLLDREKPWRELPFKSSFISLAWSPDGNHLTAGTQENMILYWPKPFAADNPLNMSGYPLKVKQLAWDAKSRFLATGGGDVITVWNVSGRGPAGTRPAQLSGHEQKLTALAFQNVGPYLASGDAAGKVRLWEPRRGQQGVELAIFSAAITDLCWAPDDHALAVGAADGTMSVLALP